MSEIKKKPVMKTLIYGAVSLSSYIYLFMNESLVTETYTKGAYYAAFPILTAFWFSFVHGAFGSNLLTTLGFEAKKAKKK
ncbi:hypothetical protein H8E50_10710 [bacterium]|nr:hypothetical protein [bacterium]